MKRVWLLSQSYHNERENAIILDIYERKFTLFPWKCYNHNHMQLLPRNKIPDDYHYYRSGFPSYRDYTAFIFLWLIQVPVAETWFFWWISRFFFGLFSVAKFLKTPYPPTKELLESYGMEHGLVFWSPWWETPEDMRSWHRLPTYLSRRYHHANRSSFSVLDTPEYSKKWLSNARNHLKQIRKNIESWKIEIWEVDIETWISIYRKTTLPHKYKRYHTSVLLQISKLHGEKLRIVLAFLDGAPLAGAVFLDEKPTSVYFVAFQDQSAKPYHLGLAIIDWWFADSIGKWYKYLDFDHMWAPWDPESYKGYTQFKSELADYEVKFDEVWFKIF